MDPAWQRSERPSRLIRQRCARNRERPDTLRWRRGGRPGAVGARPLFRCELRVDAVGDGGRDGSVDASSVKGSTMEPPVAHPPRLGSALGDEPEVGRRVPHIRQVPVGTAR